MKRNLLAWLLPLLVIGAGVWAVEQPSRTKTWTNEVLTAADLNAEFDAIHTYIEAQLLGNANALTIPNGDSAFVNGYLVVDSLYITTGIFERGGGASRIGLAATPIDSFFVLQARVTDSLSVDTLVVTGWASISDSAFIDTLTVTDLTVLDSLRMLAGTRARISWAQIDSLNGNVLLTGDFALDGDLDFTGAQEISTTAGALTLNPATGVVVSAGKTLGIGTTVGANSYIVVSGAAGSGSLLKLTNTHATTPQGIYINFSVATPDNNTQTFLNFEDATAGRFIVWSDGDVVNHDNSYGAISDESLKQDITVSPSHWDRFKQLEFYNYRFKTDVIKKGAAAESSFGLVAQEVEVIYPSFVDSGLIGKDKKMTKWIQTSNLTLVGMSVIQELQVRVEALESK